MRSGNIRQTSAGFGVLKVRSHYLVDLKETLSRGQVLVEEWFQKRVFPSLNESEIRAFWLQVNIQQDNWIELTKNLLGK